LLENALATEDEISDIETSAKEFVRSEKNTAWSEFQQPIKVQVEKVRAFAKDLTIPAVNQDAVQKLLHELEQNREPNRREVMSTLYKVASLSDDTDAKQEALAYYHQLIAESKQLFHTHLYQEGAGSALKVGELKAEYHHDAVLLNGYEILNRYFDQLFANNPKVIAFGEDLGYIGDVNQGFAGLQNKYGEARIFDTGIRELTIMGQGIGLAQRGLRPIAEIQYLDYLLYGLQPLSDDLATLHFRSAGRQAAPLIVRTRGHRLEGIWHSGSPMGMVINSLRGIYVCVPRNMVQAAGMYNTLLQASEPAIVIECLNGYRLKEKLPSNLSSFTVPLGVTEVLRSGTDVTIVSYGSTLRVVDEAAEHLAKMGISCEVVDVQTLLPFDIHETILDH
jgi:pyruvate/2-oxoglutarate/acetoin dehydrogenase E1 component